MELAGRVVLITGGKRIGAGVALHLAALGADVALSYNRSIEEAEHTAAAVRGHNRRVFIKQADLRDATDCRALVDSVAGELGRLDILVNMASVYVEKSYESLTDDDFDQSIAVDLRSAYVCSRAAVPHMRKQGGGRIVNFSDWLAYSHRPRYTGYLPYYTAKAAVIGLTEALALELAGDNILVNAIAPGPIMAPPAIGDDEFSAVEKATPLGRWGGPVEIAKMIAALIDSDFVTGETLRVDGGRHVR